MKKHLLLGLMLSLTAAASMAAPAASVSVTTFQRGGSTVYQYTVTNNTDVPILSVSIGLTSKKLPNLKSRFWKSDIATYWSVYDSTGVEPNYFAIDASRCTPFSGMVCALRYYPDSDDPIDDVKGYVVFDWVGAYQPGDYSTLPPRPDTSLILPRTSSSVAELIVPAPDASLSTSYALIEFAGTVAERAPFPDIVEGSTLVPINSVAASKANATPARKVVPASSPTVR